MRSLLASDRNGRSPRQKEWSMNTRPRQRHVVLLAVAASLAMSGSAKAGDVDANDLAHFGRNQTQPSLIPSPIPTTASPSTVIVRVDAGFDWLDAGVGAAGSLGFALALAGAASAIRRYRTDAAAATEPSLAKEL
jgi:hypothetical protein